jgi:prepilin-type N-terminal cleavage/methylation domain-containing protein
MEGSVCKKTSNNARGFSFIEVLTAIVLFSFLVVGVLMMTTMNIKSNYYTQHHTKAVQLAESGLEFLRRINYDTELPAYAGGVTSGYGTLPNYLEFSRTLQADIGAGMSTLTVSVTWRSQGAESPPLVLTTMRIEP